MASVLTACIYIDYSQEYSKGLMAPLCVDLKELPSPETLHARMTSIALENGLLGGIGEDVVNVMLFAADVISMAHMSRMEMTDSRYRTTLNHPSPARLVNDE